MHLPNQRAPLDSENEAATGVGTMLRRAFGRLGIPSCESCRVREHTLNRLFKFKAKKNKREF